MAQDARTQTNDWLRKWFLFLPILMAAWIVYELLTSGSSGLLLGAVVGLTGGVLVPLALGWLVGRFTQKLPHMRSAFTPRHYRFDAEALFLETSDGVSLKAPYRTFSKIALHPDWILFYEAFPGLAAHVIPCDAFESKQQESVVREWLAQALKR